MEKKYEEYWASIAKKHVFGFTPKYTERIEVAIKPKLICAISENVFKELDWKIIYMDDNEVKGYVLDDLDAVAYKIDITVDLQGKVSIKSYSEKSEFWDKGRNSKNVKLFVHVFNEKIKEYDERKLNELEEEMRRRDNWDDYEVPCALPLPPKYKTPNIIIPAAGALLVSFLLAYTVSLISYKGMYLVGLVEVGVGFALGYSISQCMKLGNYLYWSLIRYVLLGAVAITYIMSNVFLYQLNSFYQGYDNTGFFEFMVYQYDSGFKFGIIELGSWAMVVHWCVQIVLTYFVGAIRISSSCFSISMSRVPSEVVEFAMYHTVKGNSQEEVENELAKMGWDDDVAQQMVFDALGTSLHMHKQFKTM